MTSTGDLIQQLKALYAPNGGACHPGTKKPACKAGSQEDENGMSKIIQNHKELVNPAMDIPLHKAYGIDEVKVTPEIAQHWLSFNTSNRELTQAKVDQFHDDMAAGYWNQDGATIRFSYGKLLDGQHRLTALALAGVTVRMIVVYGLDSEVQVTMDTGRGRTPRDVLSIEGMDQWESAVLGSALHTIIAYEKGLAIYSLRKYTNREIRNFYLEHSTALTGTINRIKGYPRRRPLLPHARAVALHYVFSRVNAEAADTFFDRLLTGENLTKTSPIYHLRNRLNADLLDKKSRTAFEQIHFVIRAWNVYRKGGTLKSDNGLRVRQGEPFPEII